MQKTRREMLTPHLFPKNFSLRFGQLNQIINDQLQSMTADLKSDSVSKRSIEIKPIIMSTCANIFTQYFASRTFADNNAAFRTMMTNFDRIFSEVNQGSAVDFLPFLLPFFQRNLRQMEEWSNDIRKFILQNIIENRYESWNVGDEPNDYVDALIDHCKQNAAPQMNWETALFALEDIVGGHSAIGNFLVKVFGFVGTNSHVQRTIQAEVDAVLERQQSSQIQLSDRNQMPYTEAVILETLRLIASPIVPHVSNQDTSIAGELVNDVCWRMAFDL
jgi:cytochrome P450 family 307 subfamily A